MKVKLFLKYANGSWKEYKETYPWTESVIPRVGENIKLPEAGYFSVVEVIYNWQFDPFVSVYCRHYD